MINPKLLHAHLIAVNSPNFRVVTPISRLYPDGYSFCIQSKLPVLYDENQEELEEYEIAVDINYEAYPELQGGMANTGYTVDLRDVEDFVLWTRATYRESPL